MDMIAQSRLPRRVKTMTWPAVSRYAHTAEGLRRNCVTLTSFSTIWKSSLPGWWGMVIGSLLLLIAGPPLGYGLIRGFVGTHETSTSILTQDDFPRNDCAVVKVKLSASYAISDIECGDARTVV